MQERAPDEVRREGSSVFSIWNKEHGVRVQRQNIARTHTFYIPEPYVYRLTRKAIPAGETFTPAHIAQVHSLLQKLHVIPRRAKSLKVKVEGRSALLEIPGFAFRSYLRNPQKPGMFLKVPQLRVEFHPAGKARGYHFAHLV